MGGLCFIPLSAAFFFIGTALFVLYQQRPSDLPPNIKSDAVFPHFIGSQLPPGVMGLVLAAIFSAAMDSNLNCCATLYLCDIHRRYIHPDAGEKESMRVLHYSTLIMGMLSICAALAMVGRQRNALDVWWKLSGIFSGGLLGLFLLGLLSRRANSRHAAIAVTAGVIVIVWMTVTPMASGYLSSQGLSWFVSPFNDNLIIVVGALTILLIGLTASRLAERQTREVRIDPLPESVIDQELST